ncbi:hypothetical protein, partial [Aeromonas caviae]
YYELAAWALHPDGQLLALAEDRRGDRDYRITLLDLASGETLASLPHRAGDLLWSLVDILPHLSASRHRRGIPITG